MNDKCKYCIHNSEGTNYIPMLMNFCINCKDKSFEKEVDKELKSSVNHPSHYNQGKIETIDYIEETVKNFEDGFEGFLVANIIKYVSRYPYKNGVEDLNKAQWYLNKLVKYKTGKSNECY